MRRNAEISAPQRAPATPVGLEAARRGLAPALGILSVAAYLGCTPPAPSAGPRANPRAEADPSAARLEAWIDSVVTQRMVEDRIPGAAVVWMQRGVPTVSKAYGLADVQALRPVTLDGTVFRIGSVSKVVTALALIRLIDRGTVGLDDPVAAHLPELAVTSPAGTPIRVRHLLSHSAGYDQVGARRQVDDPAVRPTIRDFLERELVPLREPGVVGVYDTYGITLAGHLVERASGTSYAEHVRRHIFQPLGMRSSWVEVPDSARERLAVGYGLEDGELMPQAYEWYVTLPASSMDATAADMGRLLAALLADGGGVLSPGMMQRVRTERLLSYGSMGAFSWGFWEEDREGFRALHHGGVMRGHSTELYLVPAEGVGIFVAYNRDLETGPPPRLRESLIDLLYDRVLPPDPGGREATDGEDRGAPGRPRLAAPAERVAGAYGSTVGCFTCAEGEGWPIPTIAVEAEGPGAISLYGGSARFFAIDTLVYVSEASGRELRFLADSTGGVRYMVQGPNSFARLDETLLDEVLGPGWRGRPPEPIVARVHRANEDWWATARAYASLAARHPQNGRYAFYEGFSRLHVGDWDAARSAFERAIAAGQWAPTSRYYIAAAHAGEGDAEAAWAALREAIEAGFDDARLLESDRWWNDLRQRTEYGEALRRITPGHPADGRR